LLTVIRGQDHLPEKYFPCEDPDPQSRLSETEPQPEDEPEQNPEIEPDPSIHAPLSSNGMTAARAWSTTMGQLKLVMPKAAYDNWVRNAILISHKDGIFVIGVDNAYARDWLASRLTSTAKGLLWHLQPVR
jgi:hypothetical protein